MLAKKSLVLITRVVRILYIRIYTCILYTVYLFEVYIYAVYYVYFFGRFIYGIYTAYILYFRRRRKFFCGFRRRRKFFWVFAVGKNCYGPPRLVRGPSGGKKKPLLSNFITKSSYLLCFLYPK